MAVSATSISSYRASLAPIPPSMVVQRDSPTPPSYIDHSYSPMVAQSFDARQSSPRPYISAPLNPDELLTRDLTPEFTNGQDGRKGKLSFTEEGLPPYLGLRSRMFLSLFSAPLIALIFTATHLLISSTGINESVAQAKEKLLDVCHAAEMEASALASLPHWMADTMNQRTSQVVTDTVHGVGRVLSLAVTAVENLLIFLADAYRSLFQCFIELLVRGALALVMGAVSLLNSIVRETAAGIETTIRASVTAINSFLSTTITGLNDILSIVGQSISVPTIAQPDLGALSNVSLPASFMGALASLNDTLPTLNELKEQMDALIQTPFEALKEEINGTISTFAFNSSVLPVPPTQSIIFCNDVDLSPLDDFAHALQKFLYILLGILALAVLICLAVQILKAWYSWRCLNRHLERIQSAWQELDPRSSFYTGGQGGYRGTSDETYDSGASPLSSFLSKSHLFTLLSLTQHPLLSSFSFKVAEKVGMKSVQSQNRLRWWLAFVSHPMAVAVLALGLTGLLATQVQLWALQPVQEQYQSSFELTLSNLADTAVAQINNVTMIASEEYANRSNAVILAAQDDLNQNLFAWVNTTTSTMNASINALQAGLSEAMNSTFASTPLYSPVQTFLQCIILSRLEAVENALTWISDNAVVNFTLVPSDVLALSANRSQELASGIAGGQDGAGGAGAVFSKISQEYREKLEMERLMFALLLALYGMLVLIGSFVTFFAGEDRWRSTNGRGIIAKWSCRGAANKQQKASSTWSDSTRRVESGVIGRVIDGDEKVAFCKGESMLDGRSHDSITAPLSRDLRLEDYDLSEDQSRVRWGL